MKRTRSIWLVLVLLLTGCATAPPTLSPPARIAFTNHRVQTALDLIRDTAQDGNATTPPIVSTDAARTITAWHLSAITIIHATGQGWQTAVRAGLDELLTHLPPPEQQLFTPYVTLAKAILAEVP